MQISLPDRIVFLFWRYVEEPMDVRVFKRCARSADHFNDVGMHDFAVFHVVRVYDGLSPREKRYLCTDPVFAQNMRDLRSELFEIKLGAVKANADFVERIRQAREVLLHVIEDGRDKSRNTPLTPQ